MADDDIESCWDEIRPNRVPAPRDMSRYAKQVRESSELTDEEWDLRAALIRASIPAEDQRAGDPRSYLSQEIRAASSQSIPPVSMGTSVGEDLSDLWERPPPLTTPNPDPPVVQPQRTPEQIEAWNRIQEEARERTRSREEDLRGRASRGRALAPIRQALIAELGREPTLQEMQQVARGDFSPEIRTIREARERELGRPLVADELDQVVREAFSNQSSPMQAASEAYQQGREEGLRILNDNPSQELQRRREEYARLAREAGLPEGSITVERAYPDLVDFLDGVPPEQRLLVASLAAGELARGGFTRPSAPAVPSVTRSNEENILTRLTNDLGALGFPPESISLERSVNGGTSLTINMPVTLQTQLTGPGHSSVIFTQRR